MSRDWSAVDLILVVPQFHYDVAYLQTEEEYYPRCFDNFREAVALLEAEPEYRYTIESPFLLERFAERCPADFARLRACHARGQVEVSSALYVIPDMNLPSGESLLRQVEWGRRTVRQLLGDDVRTAWIADTWGHAPGLPGLLRHAGVEAYFFTRGMRPEWPHADFVWVGLDGSELVAHWLPGGYATLRFPAAEELATALEVRRLEATEENLHDLVAGLLPRLGQRTVLLCSGGDFARPQATGPEVVREWQARGVPVRFGSVRDYAAALLAAQDALPRDAGEFNPLFIGTQVSRIRLKQWNRQLEGALASAERLHAMLGWHGCEPGDLNLDEAWRILLKNQFHDTISGTLVDAAFADAERDYATAFDLVDRRVATLAAAAGVGGVFNPSGFDRTEWVPAADGQGTAPVTVAALAWAPPPAVAAVAEWQDVTGPLTIEHDLWQITIGADGLLTAVVDRATGRDYVRPGGPGWGDLVYRNDHGDLWLLDRQPLDGGSPASALTEPQVDDPYRRSTDPLVNDNPIGQAGRRVRLRWRRRAAETVVEARGAIGFWQNRVAFTTTITLHDGDPLIGFATRLLPHGRHFRLYACFATPWPGARARHQVACGAVERDERRYVAQDYLEALGPDGRGVRVLNAGLPGNAVTAGVASLLLFRSAAMAYKGRSETAFEEGVEHLCRYAVRPVRHAGDGDAWREGERLNRPLLVLPGRPGPAAGVTLSPGHVHLSALRSEPDGRFLVRVCEAAGRPAETVTLTWPAAAGRPATTRCDRLPAWGIGRLPG